jgi:gamma-glutamyl-gamma-aminobutyrate hydrolase PuuD
MRRIVAVSQRVDVLADRGERRDSLDQRWELLLADCGLLALRIPNNPEQAIALLEAVRPQGVLLTGGNDIAAYGGDAPERDATEAILIDWAKARNQPLFAVCRGLQMLVHRCGTNLVKVKDHAGTRHRIQLDGGTHDVNSYHHWGFFEAPMGFRVWARAEDTSVEGIRHDTLPIVGVMWHPERESPSRSRDRDMIRTFFESNA